MLLRIFTIFWCFSVSHSAAIYPSVHDPKHTCAHTYLENLPRALRDQIKLLKPDQHITFSKLGVSYSDWKEEDILVR